MDSLDLIAIGEIIKAQGIKGELKLVPLTDNPKRFKEVRRVYFKAKEGLRELFITGYRPFKGYLLVKFDGVSDLTTAENLGRGLIYIPRSERPKLPAGRFYYDEIQGLKVITAAGDFLGTIVQVMETGSNDVYVVKGSSGKEILLPAIKSVIKEIRLDEGRMVVELPPGLVEDEREC
ncbi:MAG: ribosome maturation factor RimM [Bacillota bacterium]